MTIDGLGRTGLNLLQGSCCLEKWLELTDDKLKMPVTPAGVPEVMYVTAVQIH